MELTYRLVILFVFIFFIDNTSFAQNTSAYASGYVVGNQVCQKVGASSGRPGKVTCRAPIDEYEIPRLLAQSDYYKAINLCQFSVLKGWGSEKERIRSSISLNERIISRLEREVYWASEDIKKSAYLPSETVRTAYETLSRSGSRLQSKRTENIGLKWCLSCADAQSNGAKNCKDIK
jgi:hypothetical protein